MMVYLICSKAEALKQNPIMGNKPNSNINYKAFEGRWDSLSLLYMMH